MVAGDGNPPLRAEHPEVPADHAILGVEGEADLRAAVERLREMADDDDEKGAGKAEEKRRKHAKKRQSQLRKWLEKHGRGRRDDD